MFIIDFASLTETQLRGQAAVSSRDAGTAGWQQEIWHFIELWLEESVTQISIATSGSTGRPKVIAHSKEAMAQSALATCNALQLHEGDTALLALPTDRIGGRMMLVRAMLLRMKLICLEPALNVFSQYSLLNTQYSLAAFTPAQMQHTLSDEHTRTQLARIENILVGGAPVSAALRAQIQPLPGKVFETFGMTETISHIALKKLNGVDASYVFHTLPGVSVAVNAESELLIIAPFISPEAIHTTDVVQLLSPTQFVWQGRSDFVINSGGFKIHPEALEEKLSAAITFPFIVSSQPDALLGERCVLVAESNLPDAEQQAQIEKAFALLEKNERPKTTFALQQLPHTIGGKPDRREVKRLLLQSEIRNPKS